MLIFCKVSLLIAALCGIGLAIALVADAVEVAMICGLSLAVSSAIGLGAIRSLRGYQYTAWILAAVALGMLYPEAFDARGSFNPKHPWVTLLVVQLVMFGMGTQMRLRDFRGVALNPRGVLVGLLCQFSIMPFIGWLLTRVFDFPAEVAAGVILIGSCSSGLASNVMTYLARANLALSVTVTAVATILAPLMTPLMMQLYARELVTVAFIGMMISIVKIVLVPIGAAMAHDALKRADERQRRALNGSAVAGALWLAFLATGGWAWLKSVLSPELITSVSVFSFFVAALCFGALYHQVALRVARLDRSMPYASMFGIVYFTALTTAQGREDLLRIGLALFLAAVIHNAAGYFLGYWFSRGLGLDRSSARAMALEVGLQNGGMATGLASEMGKLGTVGLASAVFSPWMNISGSILANVWSRRPCEPAAGAASSPPADLNLSEYKK